METRTYNVYGWDELPAKSKEKALDKYRYINVDFDDWAEAELDDWKAHLIGLGYIEPKIEYSGFSSQGDGARFLAEVDATEWLKAHKLSNKYRTLYNADYGDYRLSVDALTNQYSHDNTIAADGEWLNGYDKPKGYEDIEAVIPLITDEARELSRRIYADLESAYRDLTSDEAIADTLKANEYKFTENGRID